MKSIVAWLTTFALASSGLLAACVVDGLAPPVAPQTTVTPSPVAPSAAGPATTSSALPEPSAKPPPSAVLPWNGPSGFPSAGPPGVTP